MACDGDFLCDCRSCVRARVLTSATLSQRDELLVVLKELLDYLDVWMRDNTGPRELDLLERCEAAIARAEER